jgi:hypothetical protein
LAKKPQPTEETPTEPEEDVEEISYARAVALVGYKPASSERTDLIAKWGYLEPKWKWSMSTSGDLEAAIKFHLSTGDQVAVVGRRTKLPKVKPKKEPDKRAMSGYGYARAAQDARSAFPWYREEITRKAKICWRLLFAAMGLPIMAEAFLGLTEFTSNRGPAMVTFAVDGAAAICWLASLWFSRKKVFGPTPKR